MKIVIGIVLIALVLLGLIAYLVLMLNAREMIFCGDVQNQTGTSASVTRVYTTDLSANETLSEIIVKMNESQDGSVAVEDLTTVLAQYQNIIYAPVFTVDIQQVDTATYIINGTVYNGIDANGNEAAFLYNWDGSGEKGNDLYFNVTVNGQTYNFCVESYLCGQDTEVYQAVEALQIGDVINAEGFLYWYEGVNPHITSVSAAN